MTERIESIEDLQDKLSGRQVAMVATRDEHGHLSSRPVTLQRIDDDGARWFLVNRHASWVTPSDGSPVNASFTGERGLWVSCSGRLSLNGSKERLDKMLDEMSETFFEEDGEPIAMRIEARQIEWWSAPNAAVQVLDLVRAKVSDSAPKAGESGTLNVG